MKRPPLLWVAAGAEVQKHKQNVQSKHSTSHFSPQPALAQRLDLLGRLRHYLTRWHPAKGRGLMPQPQDFGLCLPPLRPSEGLWTEGRP